MILYVGQETTQRVQQLQLDTSSYAFVRARSEVAIVLEEVKCHLLSLGHTYKYSTASQIIRTFLALEVNPLGAEAGEAGLIFRTIFGRLESLLRTTWAYDLNLYRSHTERVQRSGSPRNSQAVLLIQFINNSFPGSRLISAHAWHSERRINVYLPVCFYNFRLTNPLQVAVSRMQAGQNLDRLTDYATPTLLHELLHIISDKIIDVEIVKSTCDYVLDRSEREEDHADRYTCYTDYRCRTLASIAKTLSRTQTQQDQYGRIGTCTITRGGPLQNAESLTRAICYIWLSLKRPDLDFCPTGKLRNDVIETKRAN